MVRKAQILYYNAKQLKVTAGKLTGPVQSTVRQVETLTAVTNINEDRAAVVEMVEDLSKTSVVHLGDLEQARTGVIPQQPAVDVGTADSVTDEQVSETATDSESGDISDSDGRESPEEMVYERQLPCDPNHRPLRGVQSAPTDMVTRSGVSRQGAILP